MEGNTLGCLSFLIRKYYWPLKKAASRILKNLYNQKPQFFFDFFFFFLAAQKFKQVITYSKSTTSLFFASQ